MASPVLSPTGTSASTTWQVLDNGSDDAIERLEKRIGSLVTYFGPNAQGMIQKSMEQDQINMSNLMKMEDDLKQQGDWQAANRLVKCVKAASNHSLEQVLPMRRHLEDIAELLEDIMAPENQADSKHLHEIMVDMHSSSEEARRIAVLGKQKFEQLSSELEIIQQQYQASKDKAERKQEDSKTLAQQKDRSAKALQGSSAVNGCISAVSGAVTAGESGGGIAALAGGASWVASIPGIGAALTTTKTTTASVGGFLGALGYTATTTAVTFNPVGIMVGTGMALGFGLISLKTAFDACDYSRQSAEALLEKKAAETQATACAETIAKSQKNQELAGQMVESARTHEGLWDGVSKSAAQAAHAFKTLQKTSQGCRQRRFNDKMQSYAQDLMNFVKAIDEYLFFLGKNNFFPANYPMDRVLGPQRYAELEKQWRAAEKKIIEDQ